MSATSCNDWLDVSPETEKKKEEMFSKEAGYRNVLIGAYIRMKSTSLYGDEMVHGTVEMLASHWNNTSKNTKAYYLGFGWKDVCKQNQEHRSKDNSDSAGNPQKA